MNFLPRLISAMIMVESDGRDWIVGDNGRALGCLQIHEAVIDDVNRIYGTNYIHADALYPDRARLICILYLLHYAGSHATAEQCARIWNGGPNGWAKESTISYWEKVQQRMEEVIPGE